MLCVVQKPFRGNGVDWIRDQLVDADQFRNKDVLLSQRYFRVATQDEIDSAYEAADIEQKPVSPKRDWKKPRRRQFFRKARVEHVLDV